MDEKKTIQQQLEAIAQDICDNYCKYPVMEVPEGKDENWLYEDADSPCNKCPLTNCL